MGRRVDAFLTEKDQKEFLEFAVFEKSVKLLESFGEEISIEEALNEKVVWNTVGLTFEGSEIIFDKHGEIDYYRSEIVGFGKGFTRKNRFGKLIKDAGGLGMQTRYWGKDKNRESILILKDKRNDKFYNALARWMKKNYVISTNKGYYAAPDFYERYRRSEITPSPEVEFE